MKSMKTMGMMLSLMALATGMTNDEMDVPNNDYRNNPGLSDEEIRKNHEENLKDKGVNKYNYGHGKELFAINQKSANKKAKKKGWL